MSNLDPARMRRIHEVDRNCDGMVAVDDARVQLARARVQQGDAHLREAYRLIREANQILGGLPLDDPPSDVVVFTRKFRAKAA